jgi:hypothetical protein
MRIVIDRIAGTETKRIIDMLYEADLKVEGGASAEIGVLVLVAAKHAVQAVKVLAQAGISARIG